MVALLVTDSIWELSGCNMKGGRVGNSCPDSFNPGKTKLRG